MGIYEWVTSLTGDWGPVLLAAYEANALWINGAVFLYGLLLVFSWQNGERIVDSLKRQIVAKASKMQGSGNSPQRPVRLSAMHFLWEDALAESKFPLFARQTDLVPRRCTLENARKAFSNEYLNRQLRSKLRRLGVELEA